MNPKDHSTTSVTKTWRKKNERLQRDCTAKGKKSNSVGGMAHFFIAISYHARGSFMQTLSSLKLRVFSEVYLRKLSRGIFKKFQFKDTIESFPIEVIDRIVKSMHA